MQTAKRLEIIVNEIDVESVTRILQESGARGYTVFPGLVGWGDRGLQQREAVTGTTGTACVFCICDDVVAHVASDRIRPVLRLRGGVCSVSETTIIR